MRKCPLAKPSDVAECVILAAGDFPSEGVARSVLDGARHIVCCDSAAEELLALGRMPDAVVGDLDSLSEAAAEALADRLHRVPDQNTNDLWKSLSYAIGEGFKYITVLGGFGRREDHSIGNVMLLASRASEAEIRMIGTHGVFDFVCESTAFESWNGQQVSVFTPSAATRVEFEGLMYTPPEGHLPGLWYGVSNQSCADEFVIRTDGPTIVYRLF
jgi:thiamine pyrophosphokinase